MEKQKRIHRSGLAVSLLCAAVLAACASVGINDNLEAARAEVNSASADPDVVSRAPLELKNAQEALNRADNLNRGRESIAEVNHHAYLAAVRAQTAKDLARSRRDTDEMTRMQGEVDRLRLANRTREANVARADANMARADASAARTDAAIARDQAQVAAQQAAAASVQAQSATQQADIERARAAQSAADAADAREKLRVVIVELQGKETDRGLLVTLGDVLFQTGRAELLPNAGPRMDKLASYLNQFPDKSLLIEGYTDSVGSDATNQELSIRRAEAVRAALAQRGVSPTRMASRGYGEQFPVASNSSAEGRAMNRRVEVVVADDRGNLKPRA
ncbi:Peptidoglycan-associated lipoprotein [Usitatibacter rugosus]|uniref:Peptidoglycan-associated lipoprotein n=1 Tax=Usitatibacter rugosus TaxID=2732067 RepID=A0A6M4GSR3_9PROT|nr:OmpA family protein [Usitatibacter rugosus]QJR09343.1 Peptidoglycan-associated lipoprotein [Usitatibacter rugosus]